MVADGLIRDANNQEWLVLTEKQMTFLPVAVSDAVRFVVLHQFGGAYFDMDIIILRDMRPLLIGDEHSFAERWGGHPSPGDYNTAVMSLTANSSMSSYLLRGGVRMGLNFHPRIIGVMAVKDHRNPEFHMLETAAFDPIWTEFNWGRLGKCTVPCIHDYSQVFKGSEKGFPLDDEWVSFDGQQLAPASSPRGHFWDIRSIGDLEAREVDERSGDQKVRTATYDRDALSKAEYKIDEDHYPPTNRTLENFFRGAWTYHVHNQVRFSMYFYHDNRKLTLRNSGSRTPNLRHGSTLYNAHTMGSSLAADPIHTARNGKVLPYPITKSLGNTHRFAIPKLPFLFPQRPR